MAESSRQGKYDSTYGLINMVDEFREAAKRKPDAVLNKRKITIVNRLLRDVLEILDGEPQRQYLEMLDEDELPQNSDVTLMLGQILTAMQKFRTKYTTGATSMFGDNSKWMIPEEDREDDDNDVE